MKILITGNAGYIGSHLSLKLKELGHYTIGIDNFSSGHRKFVFTDEFYEGDYNDPKIWQNIVMEKGHEIDVIMHLANFAIVGHSFKSPNNYFTNNVKGMADILGFMYMFNIKRIIFSSSCSIYKSGNQLPLTESSEIDSMNPYGETKKLCEDLLKYYSKYTNLKYVALRYFNVAGADDKKRTGELHCPETHLIPNIIKAIIKKEPIKIYGNNFQTPDGTCVRDYIHVDDIVDAHVKAMDYLRDSGIPSDAFNLGTNKGRSVLEIIYEAFKILKKKTSIIYEPPRQGDPDFRIASYKKAKDILGWEPTKDLSNMIKSAYKFLKSHKL
jgi:UDP-glucose 4-epimerase